MNRLTRKERRRLYLARQRASEAVPAARAADSRAVAEPAAQGHELIAQIMGLLALLCGGLLVYHVVEFHPPASLTELLLPRM